MDTHQLGDPILIDSPAWGVDPTGVTIFVYDPQGVESSYVYLTDPQVVRDSLGQFHLDFTPTIEGEWKWRWVANGTVNDVSEGSFLLASEIETSLTILTGADLDAIRSLLGVTVVDLRNEIIEQPPYGPYMESRVKEIVPDWTAVMVDPDSAIRLRVALIYGVAATLAESYMKGGTVSLVQREEPRRNWSEWARIMWNRYKEALARVVSDPGEADDIYTVVPLVTTGPTRSRGRRPDWTGIYPPVWPSLD